MCNHGPLLWQRRGAGILSSGLCGGGEFGYHWALLFKINMTFFFRNSP